MTPYERGLALHNEAVAHARAGRRGAACDLLRAVIRETDADQVDIRSLKALWQIARDARDWPTALATGFKAATRDPSDFAFTDRVVHSLDACPLSALLGDDVGDSVRMPAHQPTLSVVIVSQDDARFAAVDAEYAQTFAEWPHQRIRVKGASSMYEGYARGFAQTRGEIIVFSHDDIRFATADFPVRLADAMATADVVGVAGTTRVSGPALLWSGHPYLYGTITHKAPADRDYEFAVTSLTGPRIVMAQGLDGVFIAARRELINRIGFDTSGIHGFHFYDIDFSYRAHLAGARLTIAGDLALIHASRGAFDERWSATQSEFTKKFPDLTAPPGAHRHWYALALPDVDAVRATYAKLFAAWKLPPP